jgi:tripartite-type tricarboxylate transporter receptor subunit TctC
MQLLSGKGKSLLCAFAASVVSVSAFAQAWPTGTVTVVVPWPPGGPSDIAARPFAKSLTAAVGQTFVIDNRAGGGGNIGSAAVARAKPDGQTLLVTSSAPIVINPSLYKNMTFDPLKDLAPISNLLRVPLVLVANPSVPAKNLKELIAHIQSKQGKFVRFVRQRHAAAPDGRVVQQRLEARHDPRAVQGFGAGDRRPAGRSHSNHVRQHHRDHAAH